MEQTLTISIQDYLKNIYELTENGESASTNALARKLNIKRAFGDGHGTETCIGKTRARGISKTSGRDVDEGRQESRAWKSFVITVCWKPGLCKRSAIHGMKSMKRRNDSNTSSRRISSGASPQQWDIPLRDPHGELIPTADLKMPFDDSTPTFRASPGSNRDRSNASKPLTRNCSAILKDWPGPRREIEVKDILLSITT